MGFDLTLEQLLHYKGKSPKPERFKEYWARALKELDELPLQYELVPADFQSPHAECYHMYFTGVGGSRLHAKSVGYCLRGP